MKVSIDKIIYGGKGLGRLPDGRCVFVPRVCGGETVEIDISKNKSDFCEGIVHEISEPSPDRIEARCPYFSECGGCDFQHMQYENQLFWKTQFVRESFERMGKFAPADIISVLQPIVRAENSFQYRNKTEFFFFEILGKWKLGLHRAKDASLCEVQSCLLHSQRAEEVLAVFHEFLHQEIVQESFKDMKNLFSLIIRTNNQGHVLIVITTNEKTKPSFEKGITLLKEKFGENLKGVLIMQKKGTKNLTFCMERKR